ncbi:MAG: hypothetical protein PHW93_02510 [Candidatus Methanomethylophilaceae archaeon]|nr:hypothetical protein [Candidatus Methanomethylophilaceae archaeon]
MYKNLENDILEVRGVTTPFLRKDTAVFLSAVVIFLSLGIVALINSRTPVMMVGIISILSIIAVLHVFVYLTISNDARKDSASILMDDEKVALENNFIDRNKDIPDKLYYNDIDHVNIHFSPSNEDQVPFLITFITKEWKTVNGGIKQASSLIEAKSFLEGKGIRVEEQR